MLYLDKYTERNKFSNFLNGCDYFSRKSIPMLLIASNYFKTGKSDCIKIEWKLWLNARLRHFLWLNSLHELADNKTKKMVKILLKCSDWVHKQENRNWFRKQTHKKPEMGHVNLTLNCRKKSTAILNIINWCFDLILFLRFITDTMEDIITQNDFPKSPMFSKATTRTFQILNRGVKLTLGWKLTKFVDSNDPCILLRKEKH